jgi:hypothetical protein
MIRRGDGRGVPCACRAPREVSQVTRSAHVRCSLQGQRGRESRTPGTLLVVIDPDRFRREGPLPLPVRGDGRCALSLSLLGFRRDEGILLVVPVHTIGPGDCGVLRTARRREEGLGRNVYATRVQPLRTRPAPAPNTVSRIPRHVATSKESNCGVLFVVVITSLLGSYTDVHVQWPVSARKQLTSRTIGFFSEDFP